MFSGVFLNSTKKNLVQSSYRDMLVVGCYIIQRVVPFIFLVFLLDWGGQNIFNTCQCNNSNNNWTLLQTTSSKNLREGRIYCIRLYSFEVGLMYFIFLFAKK